LFAGVFVFLLLALLFVIVFVLGILLRVRIFGFFANEVVCFWLVQVVNNLHVSNFVVGHRFFVVHWSNFLFVFLDAKFFLFSPLDNLVLD